MLSFFTHLISSGIRFNKNVVTVPSHFFEVIPCLKWGVTWQLIVHIFLLSFLSVSYFGMTESGMSSWSKGIELIFFYEIFVCCVFSFHFPYFIYMILY